MQRHWKRYLLLIALVAVLLYVAWRVYEDYELSSYPQRVADSIPVPSGVQLIEQRDGTSKKCRSAVIVRYYATDTPWEDIAAFYSTYVQSPFWKPRGNETRFFHQLNTHEVINFSFAHIPSTYSGDLELAALAQEKTVYALQVNYLQDDRLFEIDRVSGYRRCQSNRAKRQR